MLWKRFVCTRSVTISQRNCNSLVSVPTVLLSYFCRRSSLYYCYYRPCQRPILPFSDSVRYMHDSFSKNPSTSTGIRLTDEEQLPTKEQLFYVDCLTDVLVPGFLKSQKEFFKFMKLCTKDIVYDDSIFNRHTQYRA
ncbi:unnamed protein product [Litomosoides sigmodontis]|uniref:Uncharacterized protein n=1 Tax=Litomosoides sigmodontis TaxID=42156 RepID=A0A3P6T8Q5_LITSI|nr:unnamed protein product [Litomosoides sigmodontis]